MTTSTSIDIPATLPGMATREMGNVALATVVRALNEFDIVELDFAGHSPSPSFADQCIGGVAGILGLAEFKRRVRLRNAPVEAQALLRHVVLRKAEQHVAWAAPPISAGLIATSTG